MGLGEESDAFQELNRAQTVQCFSSLYHGVVGRWSSTRVLHDELATRSSGACLRILKTRPGKKVDQLLAGATRKARHAIFIERIVTTISVLQQVLMGWIEFFFRYFLPMMLLRWTVDFALFSSEAALAFWRDFARWDVSQWTPTEESVPTEQKEPETEPKEKGSEESDRELRSRPTRRGPFSFIKALITALIIRFFQAIYYFTDLVNLFFIIPILSYQVIFLTELSHFLHHIAGLDKIDNECQKRQRQFVTAHLVHRPQKPVRDMLKNKWLLDSVLDYYTGLVRQNTYFAQKFDDMGIRQPIKLARNIQGFLKKLFLSLVDGDLVPYLRTDPNYKESEDKDFKPVDISSDDDSLEYADDDLGAEDASLKDAEEKQDKDNHDA